MMLANKPYIFVTVGSTDFDALTEAVDRIVPLLGHCDGIMQIGQGQYKPVNMAHFRFAASLDPYYERASLVIAHGGLGITMEVLRRGLPLVSVSNLDRYDNHQDDLLKVMADAGHLIWCRQLNKIEQAIETARQICLKPYAPPPCKIHYKIHAFLKPLG